MGWRIIGDLLDLRQQRGCRMWQVYFSGSPAGMCPRLVIDRVRDRREAVEAAKRLTVSYQLVSPSPNGYYYVVSA